MKTKQLACLLALLFPCFSYAQPYNDVAVIVNDNSQTSIDIGNYFQQARNIPSQHMIHINCTTNEVIDSAEFEAIRQQIEAYLVNNNLEDSINYLVTTKGVPLRVERDSCIFPDYSQCSSFDNELVLLLSGQTIPNNSYFGGDNYFSRATYDMYLVTRLDAYTKQQVFDLIDRSGPNTLVNQNSASFVFDLSNVNPSSQEYFLFEQTLLPISDSLNADGWNSTYEGTNTILYNEVDVLGFSSINGDTATNSLNYTWEDGSFAHLIYGPTATTFDVTQNPGIVVELGDLIEEGATAGCGYAYPTYFSVLLQNELFFPYYTDTAMGYNLAESMYMSIPYLSNKRILIGDPKTTIRIDNTAGEDPISIDSKIEVYPNPTNGLFTLQLQDIRSHEIQVVIYDQLGKIIYNDALQGGQISNIAHPVNLSGQSNGMYFIHILTEEGRAVKKLVLSN